MIDSLVDTNRPNIDKTIKLLLKIMTPGIILTESNFVFNKTIMYCRFIGNVQKLVEKSYLMHFY